MTVSRVMVNTELNCALQFVLLWKGYMPAVAKNDNDADARKTRKTQIQRDEAIGYAWFITSGEIMQSSFSTLCIAYFL